MAEKGVSRPIEDYALVGNLSTAALIGRGGAIDWFCPPRFDAAACFAALLGDGGNGSWRLAPEGGTRRAGATCRTPWCSRPCTRPRTGRSRSSTSCPIRDRRHDRPGAAGARAQGGSRWRPRSCSASTTARSCPGSGTATTGMHAIGGPDAVVIRTAGAAQGRRLPHPRPLHRRRRRDGAVRAHLLPLAPRRTPRPIDPEAAEGDRAPGGASGPASAATRGPGASRWCARSSR